MMRKVFTVSAVVLMALVLKRNHDETVRIYRDLYRKSELVFIDFLRRIP